MLEFNDRLAYFDLISVFLIVVITAFSSHTPHRLVHLIRMNPNERQPLKQRTTTPFKHLLPPSTYSSTLSVAAEAAHLIVEPLLTQVRGPRIVKRNLGPSAPGIATWRQHLSFSLLKTQNSAIRTHKGYNGRPGQDQRKKPNYQRFPEW